jgi:O-antigen/teichoic acid export membrane protein
MTLLGNFCILGLGTLLIGELSQQPGQEAPLISGALLLVGAVGGCVAPIFALVASYLSANFQMFKGGFGDIMLFAVGVSLTAVTLVLDQAFIGLMRGSLQLWRNTLFATTKLVALIIVSFWFSHITGMTIYVTWAIGNALSLIALAGFIFSKKGALRRTYLPQWGIFRKLRAAALQHHLLNLALQAPALILPIQVTVLLSATANAWFYISWMISGFFLVLPYALTTALYAASSAQPATLAHRIRFTLALAIVTNGVAVGLLLLSANLILALFGHTYAEQAALCLRILSLAAFPLIIKDHYISICRVQKQLAYALFLITAGVVVELCAAALGARLGGLTGLSLAWVIAVCIEATFMFHTVYKAARYLDTSAYVDQSRRYVNNHDTAQIIGGGATKADLGQSIE